MVATLTCPTAPTATLAATSTASATLIQLQHAQGIQLIVTYPLPRMHTPRKLQEWWFRILPLSKEKRPIW